MAAILEMTVTLFQEQEASVMSGLSEEDMREYEKLHDAVIEDEKRMKELEADITAAVKKLIVEHYQETFHLESDGYKALDNAIWKHVDRLVRDVNRIASTMLANK